MKREVTNHDYVKMIENIYENSSAAGLLELQELTTHFASIKDLLQENIKNEQFMIRLLVSLKFEKIPSNKRIINIGRKGGKCYFLLEGKMAKIALIKKRVITSKEEYCNYLNFLLTKGQIFLVKKTIDVNENAFNVNFESFIEEFLKKVSEYNPDFLVTLLRNNRSLLVVSNPYLNPNGNSDLAGLSDYADLCATTIINTANTEESAVINSSNRNDSNEKNDNNANKANYKVRNRRVNIVEQNKSRFKKKHSPINPTKEQSVNDFVNDNKENDFCERMININDSMSNDRLNTDIENDNDSIANKTKNIIEEKNNNNIINKEKQKEEFGRQKQFKISNSNNNKKDTIANKPIIKTAKKKSYADFLNKLKTSKFVKNFVSFSNSIRENSNKKSNTMKHLSNSNNNSNNNSHNNSNNSIENNKKSNLPSFLNLKSDYTKNSIINNKPTLRNSVSVLKINSIDKENFINKPRQSLFPSIAKKLDSEAKINKEDLLNKEYKEKVDLEIKTFVRLSLSNQTLNYNKFTKIEKILKQANKNNNNNDNSNNINTLSSKNKRMKGNKESKYMDIGEIKEISDESDLDSDLKEKKKKKAHQKNKNDAYFDDDKEEEDEDYFDDNENDDIDYDNIDENNTMSDYNINSTKSNVHVNNNTNNRKRSTLVFQTNKIDVEKLFREKGLLQKEIEFNTDISKSIVEVKSVRNRNKKYRKIKYKSFNPENNSLLQEYFKQSFDDRNIEKININKDINYQNINQNIRKNTIYPIPENSEVREKDMSNEDVNEDNNKDIDEEINTKDNYNSAHSNNSKDIKYNGDNGDNCDNIEKNLSYYIEDKEEIKENDNKNNEDFQKKTLKRTSKVPDINTNNANNSNKKRSKISNSTNSKYTSSSTNSFSQIFLSLFKKLTINKEDSENLDYQSYIDSSKFDFINNKIDINNKNKMIDLTLPYKNRDNKANKISSKKNLNYNDSNNHLDMIDQNYRITNDTYDTLTSHYTVNSIKTSRTKAQPNYYSSLQNNNNINNNNSSNGNKGNYNPIQTTENQFEIEYYEHHLVEVLEKDYFFGDEYLEYPDYLNNITYITTSETNLLSISKRNYDRYLKTLRNKQKERITQAFTTSLLFKGFSVTGFYTKFFVYFKSNIINKRETLLKSGEKNNDLFFLFEGDYQVKIHSSLLYICRLIEKLGELIKENNKKKINNDNTDIKDNKDIKDNNTNFSIASNLTDIYLNVNNYPFNLIQKLEETLDKPYFIKKQMHNFFSIGNLECLGLESFSSNSVSIFDIECNSRYGVYYYINRDLFFMLMNDSNLMRNNLSIYLKTKTKIIFNRLVQIVNSSIRIKSISENNNRSGVRNNKIINDDGNADSRNKYSHHGSKSLGRNYNGDDDYNGKRENSISGIGFSNKSYVDGKKEIMSVIGNKNNSITNKENNFSKSNNKGLVNSCNCNINNINVINKTSRNNIVVSDFNSNTYNNDIAKIRTGKKEFKCTCINNDNNKNNSTIDSRDNYNKDSLYRKFDYSNIGKSNYKTSFRISNEYSSNKSNRLSSVVLIRSNKRNSKDVNKITVEESFLEYSNNFDLSKLNAQKIINNEGLNLNSNSNLLERMNDRSNINSAVHKNNKTNQKAFSTNFNSNSNSNALVLPQIKNNNNNATNNDTSKDTSNDASNKTTLQKSHLSYSTIYLKNININDFNTNNKEFKSIAPKINNNNLSPYYITKEWDIEAFRIRNEILKKEKDHELIVNDTDDDGNKSNKHSNKINRLGKYNKSSNFNQQQLDNFRSKQNFYKRQEKIQSKMKKNYNDDIINDICSSTNSHIKRIAIEKQLHKEKSRIDKESIALFMNCRNVDNDLLIKSSSVLIKKNLNSNDHKCNDYNNSNTWKINQHDVTLNNVLKLSSEINRIKSKVKNDLVKFGNFGITIKNSKNFDINNDVKIENIEKTEKIEDNKFKNNNITNNKSNKRALNIFITSNNHISSHNNPTTISYNTNYNDFIKEEILNDNNNNRKDKKKLDDRNVFLNSNLTNLPNINMDSKGKNNYNDFDPDISKDLNSNTNIQTKTKIEDYTKEEIEKITSSISQRNILRLNKEEIHFLSIIKNNNAYKTKYTKTKKNETKLLIYKKIN